MLIKTVLLTNCMGILLVSGGVIFSNKTHHSRRPNTEENNYFKNSKTSYRSFQPFLQYHKTYPRPEAPDYDGITSYDNEYGGMVSNFTSSVYDDNPPLYPNPEIISNTQALNKIDERSEVEVDIPDDSLADADLKEHNIIDSVTYLYGFSNCHGVRNEWMILVFFTSGLSICILLGTISWMIWSERASEFRRHSKLYPININLCCCLAACMLIYIQAAMGVSSPSQCERIALLLHYTHIACALWIAMLACAVAEYSARRTVPPLKYNYLLAYGVPCVVVMFNYALSMEHYETKHYCWMSIEKGMVLGFMVPAMLLIVLNTCVVIVGLQGVNKMQAEMLSATIQELVDHHIANWPKTDSTDDKNGSLDNIYTPSSSRKNTDTSENLSEDECPCNLGQGEVYDSKSAQDKSLLNMLYMDNMSWKWSWNTEGNELKTYLHLCLVLQPFFAINWVMGVVAIENAAHWSTPTVYLILVIVMVMYLCGTICSTMPVIGAEPSCCEDVIIVEATLHRTRTTDSIPLLDPSVQQLVATPAPADTISTISI